MASSITITQGLTDAVFGFFNYVLAAHSPSIIQFEVDPDGKTIEKVEVIVSVDNPATVANTFEITGIENSSNNFEFRFDFMDLFKIIATANIVDNWNLGSPFYDLDIEELTHHAYYKILVTYTDTSTDTFDETDTGQRRPYMLLNAVRQTNSYLGSNLGEYLPFASTVQPILSPRPPYNALSSALLLLTRPVNLTIFKGYPLCIGFLSVQSSTSQDYTITESNTSDTLVLSSVPHLNYKKRLIRASLSLGGSFTLDLGLGRNTLTISNDLNDSVCVINAEIVDKTVIYVKWLNSLGYWSYWGFSCQGSVSTEIETESRINELIQNFATSTSNFRVTSKSKKKTLTIFDNHLNEEKLNFIEEMAESLHVYLYKAPKNTAYNKSYWQRVDVDKYKEKRKAYQKSFAVEIELTLPNQYTQSV